MLNQQKNTFMNLKKIIKPCGSICKTESLIPLKEGILKNTCVAIANEPYSDYYGSLPKQTGPNSLFLFTAKHYSLEEVLRFSQNIDSCYTKEVNVASSVLEYKQHNYNAIRIKYFPDYEHIKMLQECCIKVGIEFIKHVHMPENVHVKINKCFVLEELGKGIYLDIREEHKGYILIPRQIEWDRFKELLMVIRNNNDCQLFDAALGAIIMDSRTTDMVRIYSENLNLELLKCIKNKLGQSSQIT